MSKQGESLGFMIVARKPCGKVAAMAWDDPEYSENKVKELCRDVIEWRRQELEVVKIERFSGDPMPEWVCAPCTGCNGIGAVPFIEGPFGEMPPCID